MRHAHRSRHGRGGPRRPGPPGLLRPEAGPAGFVPGVPPPRPSWSPPTPRAWRAGSAALSTRPTPARLGCRRWSAGWRSAIRWCVELRLPEFPKNWVGIVRYSCLSDGYAEPRMIHCNRVFRIGICRSTSMVSPPVRELPPRDLIKLPGVPHIKVPGQPPEKLHRSVLCHF